MEIETLTNARDLRLTTGKTVQVRGLSWGDAFRFLKRAGDSMKELFVVEESGGVKADLNRVPDLIVESEELAAVLLGSAAGLAAEEIDALPIEDVLALLDAALELTLTDGLQKNAAALGARLGGLFQQAKARQGPSTTSSPRDTQPKQYPGTRSPS